MGKIPLYQSNERLATTAPQAVRQSPQAAGQAGRDLEGAGEAIAGAHNTIREAYNFQQVGSAKVKALEGMSALEQRALTDGDNTGDFTQYDGEIRRVKEETLAGISNPAVRSKFEMDFDLQAAQTRTAITSVFRKNMVAKGLANLGTMNEYFVNEYAKTGDASYIDNMNLNIDTYVKQGFIGADDAQKLKTAATLKAKDAQFIFDKENNPALAKEKLLKNSYGFDTVTLEKANNVFDREMNKIQNIAEEGAIDSNIKGNLTIGDVKNLRLTGKVSAKFAESMIARLQRGSNVKTDASEYMNAVDIVLSQDMTAKSKREYLMELVKQDKLSDTDFKNLYKNRVSGFPSVAELYMSDKMTDSEKAQKLATEPPDLNFLRSAVGVLKGSGFLSPMTLPAATMRLFDMIQGRELAGEAIPQMAKSILREVVIAQIPSIALKKDIPNIVYHNGEAKKVFGGDSNIEVQKSYKKDPKQYAIGDEEDVGGISYRVTGFDTDGEPIVEEE